MSARLVVIAGNPNVGKTSLFNALTGHRHKVGNYAGVTVECREGQVLSRLSGSHQLRIVDVPGTYSLTPVSDDERAADAALRGELFGRPDLICLVLDATNLARNLYFALQVLELGVPVVVALNMVDQARRLGGVVNRQALAESLGVPVIETVARDEVGTQELVDQLGNLDLKVPQRSPALISLAQSLAQISKLAPVIAGQVDPSAAPRTASGEASLTSLPAIAAADIVMTRVASLVGEHPPLRGRSGAPRPESEFPSQSAPDEVFALGREIVAARYAVVDELLADLDEAARRDDAAGQSSPPDGERRALAPRTAMEWSERADSVLTHRVLGPLLFIAIMGTLFNAIFTLATPIMDGLESLVAMAGDVVAQTLGPGALTDLLTQGVLAGVGNVVVFVPQIALLFLLLGLLEETGYMARAAFLIDRVMHGVGLHGRAFVPLLSGYACAIPAIMSTRVLTSYRDRVLTILIIPFMSCSARLPVYGLVIYAVLGGSESFYGPITVGAVWLLAMYLLGTFTGLAFGAIYRRTILRGPVPPLVLELPPYRVPKLKSVLLAVWDRCADFLRDAGTVILTCSVILWALLTYPRVEPDQLGEDEVAIERSYGGRFGKAIEPVLRPMGQDWRVGIGLVASFAAREVLVSTLGLVYGIEQDAPERDLGPDAKEANAGEASGDETGQQAADPDRRIRRAFRDATDAAGQPRNTPLKGVALMVFFVFAAQCMSTLAVVRRETGTWAWPVFMFVSMTTIAYVAATVTYQLGWMLGFR